MALSADLIKSFAKITNDQDTKTTTKTSYNGTAVAYAGSIYVRLDGSDQLTPVTSTAGMKDGDRVVVTIENHSATVTGNVSSPSAGKDDVDGIQGELDDAIDQISEFEIVLAGKVDTEVLNAEKARIDELVAENVTIKEKLTATEADIGNLEADNVTINEKLTAAEADIDELHANMLTAEVADLKYATIENLEATNADIYNLEATYAQFEQTTTGKLDAVEADIQDLEANKLSAEQADLKYAQIDFANIGKAAIEAFFSKSGMIGDLVVGDGTITGHLVGVTISGDLIEGNTIKADKLVVLGEDGLYYKLNVNAETVSGQQTEYNSINGSIITANTITAEKINVNDLVAFDATIGGFKITDSSLYSGVKESIDNTTRGIYMDDMGQIVFGDQSNYLKYFHDETDDTWKLIISAGSIKLGSSSKDLEEVIEDISDKAVTETVSGEGYVSIPENAGKKPYELVVYGKTQQNFWVNPDTTVTGVTVTSNDDGSFTLSGTGTGAGNADSVNIYSLKPGGTYTLWVSGTTNFHVGVSQYVDGVFKSTKAIRAGSGARSITFTLGSDVNMFTCVVFGFASGTTYSGTYRVMLNEGEEAEPWCPPGLNSIESLDYISAGKNLFEASSEQFDIVGNGGQNQFSKIGYLHGERIPLNTEVISSLEYRLDSGGGTITIQMSTSPYLGIGISYIPMIADGEWHKIVSDSFPFGDEKRLFKSYQIRLDNVSGNLSVRNIQIERGTTATEYESPSITTTPIDLQGNVLSSLKDGTRDELHIYRDGSRKIIKRCLTGVIPESSDLIWEPAPGSRARFDAPYPVKNSSFAEYDVLSSSLAQRPFKGSVIAGSYIFAHAQTNSIYLRVDGKTTVDDLSAVVSGDPYVAALDESYEITLDPIELPELNAESAMVILDTGVQGLYPDLDLTYWTKFGKEIADAQTDIDNFNVGATNLALYTSRAQTYVRSGSNGWFMNKNTDVEFIYGPRTSDLGLKLIPEGGEFTLSFDYEIINCTTSFDLKANLEYQSGSYTTFGEGKTIPVGDTVTGHFSTTAEPSANQKQWGRGFLFSGLGNGTATNPNLEMTITNFKFEKGNKETTWSQAPEELASGDYVDGIEESLSSDISDLEESINEAYISIDSINAKMEFLVTDEEGNSMMTQTSDGWTFNMSAIQNTVDKAIEDIDTIHGDISSANKIINDTKNLVDDISQKTAYINLGQDESGAPCILLGETTSPFKLRITNTSIDFMEGSDKIAYVTNRQLYIQSSVVTDEMRVGSIDKETGKFEGFVWKKRANGNMGLRWEG